jgi:hypothetical protein
MNGLIGRGRGACVALVVVAVGCGGGSQSAPPPERSAQEAPQGDAAAPSAGGAATDDAGAASTTATAPAEAADAGAPSAAGATAQGEDLPPMPADLHGPAHPWAQMNHQDRAHWMGQAVMPAMSALFSAYDATRFAHVTCATCHGENARAVNFRMPNALPALPAPMSPAWQAMAQREARMMHFMGRRVAPATAQLLGVEPFNPQTRQGFGCFNCHPHEGT